MCQPFFVLQVFSYQQKNQLFTASLTALRLFGFYGFYGCLTLVTFKEFIKILFSGPYFLFFFLIGFFIHKKRP